MSKQTTLDGYFKSRANNPLVLMNNTMESKHNFKRRSLSLNKTPQPYKSRKKAVDIEEVICLSSSSEEFVPSKSPIDSATSNNEKSSALSQNIKKDESFDSSQTISYTLSPSTSQLYPRTPNKSLSSPRSAEKFYSPTKKRLVKNRSPTKRNLSLQFRNDSTQNETKNGEATKENVPKFNDDKTLFLLAIIKKYLQNNELKHLLDNPSQELLSKCMHIPESSMRVVCRLFWRQPAWYRTEKLIGIATHKIKKDIPDMPALLESLVNNGFITVAHCTGENSMSFDDCVKLLKKPELDQICKELKLRVKTKHDAVKALKMFSHKTGINRYFTGNVANNSTRVMNILRSKTGQCYRLSELASTTLHNLYILMYLGIDYNIIRENRLELILLRDKLNDETYPIDKTMEVDNASVVFKSKEEFYRYLGAHNIYEMYINSTDTQEKCKLIIKSYQLYKNINEQDNLRYKSLQPWLRRFTPGNVYVKILESGVQELKKAKTESQYSLAVEILDSLIGQTAFRQHKRYEWYAEKALILHKNLKCYEQAAKTLLEGFDNKCLSDEAKDVMRPRAMLIANQLNVDLDDELRIALRCCAELDLILESSLPADHIYKQPVDNYNQRGKLKFEVHTEEGRTYLSAEEYCILYYKAEGKFTHGEHWEGRMMITIFFLLFWDIIYTKPVGILGIFLNHYQLYPLDMYTENFYINRKALIDDRLIFIEESTDDTVIEMMQNRWEERPTYEMSDINRGISWLDVEAVASCLGPRSIAAICRRLAHNYGYAHSGFPDLTLWNIHTKKIKFVEVKTDADKPSMKQLQWLKYLTSHKMAAGFCYVGVNTTRCKARAQDITFS